MIFFKELGICRFILSSENAFDHSEENSSSGKKNCTQHPQLFLGNYSLSLELARKNKHSILKSEMPNPFFYIILFGLACQSTTSGQPPPVSFDQSADNFARDVGKKITALLYSAGTIDPQSNKEIPQLKEEILNSQKELDNWLRGKGRNVRYEECLTPTDKKNYKIFWQVMANKRFLRLSYSKRMDYIDSIKTYFQIFDKEFSTSFNKMLSQSNGSLERENQRLLEFFTSRFSIPIKFEFRYFSQNRQMSIGALYLAQNARIALNLNSLIQSPFEFIDALEHEIWHHLIALSTTDPINENMWLEGFTEAVTEIWSELFSVNLNHTRLKNNKLIQYPVQTAFASIYFGLNQSLTMYYLTGIITKEDFVSRFPMNNHLGGENDHRDDLLRKDVFGDGIKSPLNLGHFSKDSAQHEFNGAGSRTVDQQLRERLSNLFKTSTLISDVKKGRIEDILSNWGWKEDDQSRLDISRFIKNGRLDPKAFAFNQEKQLLLDLVEAITVLNFQQLRKVIPSDYKFQNLKLPNHNSKVFKKPYG